MATLLDSADAMAKHKHFGNMDMGSDSSSTTFYLCCLEQIISSV